MVARDCMIAKDTGAAIDVQHISSANSVAMVRLAKSLGANVWAEVTPHHFTLTEEAVLEHGTLAKMNPPLRTAADRDALIGGLKDGTIDMIATDHAPHSAEEKGRPLYRSPQRYYRPGNSFGAGNYKSGKQGTPDYGSAYGKNESESSTSVPLRMWTSGRRKTGRSGNF